MKWKNSKGESDSFWLCCLAVGKHWPSSEAKIRERSMLNQLDCQIVWCFYPFFNKLMPLIIIPYKYMQCTQPLCDEFTVSERWQRRRRKKNAAFREETNRWNLLRNMRGSGQRLKMCLQPLLVFKTISKPPYRQTGKSIRPRQTRWTSFTLVGETQMKLWLVRQNTKAATCSRSNPLKQMASCLQSHTGVD